jgi:hypothetical protein
VSRIPTEVRPTRMSRPREKAEGTEQVTDFASRGPHAPSQRGPATGTGFSSRVPALTLRSRVLSVVDETAKWFAGVQVAASGSPPWKNAPPAVEAKNTFIFRSTCDDTPTRYACGAFYGRW